MHQSHACLSSAPVSSPIPGSFPAVDGGSTYHADTPSDHDDGQEDTRAQPLEQDIGQGFETGVRDEEDGQTGIVLAVRHVEISLQAVDFGIADVCAVEEGDQVQETQLRSLASVFESNCSDTEKRERNGIRWGGDKPKESV